MSTLALWLRKGWLKRGCASITGEEEADVRRRAHYFLRLHGYTWLQIDAELPRGFQDVPAFLFYTQVFPSVAWGFGPIAYQR